MLLNFVAISDLKFEVNYTEMKMSEMLVFKQSHETRWAMLFVFTCTKSSIDISYTIRSIFRVTDNLRVILKRTLFVILS